MKKIGVLSLQGGFEKHLAMVKRCGALGVEVRYSHQLQEIDGLILPGGESTTIGKLLDRNGFIPEIQKLIGQHFPIFSTCAGTILLADTIENSLQIKIGGLPIVIRRNAYGSQVDSFESFLHINILKTIPFPGIFIRAPQIISCSPEITILAQIEEFPVLIQYESLFSATFHPELSEDPQLHDYFVSIIS